MKQSKEIIAQLSEFVKEMVKDASLELEEVIIAMYRGGLSTRDISKLNSLIFCWDKQTLPLSWKRK